MNAPLDVKTEPCGETLLLIRLHGRLDSTTSPMLELKIKEALDENSNLKRVLFACGGLHYISSAGLSVFLGLVRQLGGAGEVSLSEVSSSIHKVVKMAGFTKFINVYDDTEKAITTLNGASS